jgi:hypothetical protein
LTLPRSIRGWNLASLRDKLVKIGAKVVTDAKYVVFQLEEMAVPRQLFAAMLDRVSRLRLAGASGLGSPRWTKRTRHCPRESVVRRSGRFRRMSEEEEACAAGSALDKTNPGSAFGENPCDRIFGGLCSAIGVVAVASERLHLGKIGEHLAL